MNRSIDSTAIAAAFWYAKAQAMQGAQKQNVVT